MSDSYNRNYGRIALNGELVHAPSMIWPNPNAPTAAEYAAAGWLPVIDEPPTDPAPDGQHYEPQGWEVVNVANVETLPITNTNSQLETGNIGTGNTGNIGNIIKRVYALVADPPAAPRTFDKYRLVNALMEAGIWADVKAWLQSIPDAYDRAVMAPDISEDEPLLADGIAAAKAQFGLTDEQIAAMLDAAEVGA